MTLSLSVGVEVSRIENEERMLSVLFRSLCLVVAFVTLSACGKLKMSVTDLAEKSVFDFEKTEIVTNGVALADGLDELIVLVRLKNSDNSIVVDFRPTYDITVGTGVIKAACTASDNHGISVCILKSTIAGVKKMRLTNAKLGLESELTFKARTSNVLGVYAGGASNATTANGSRVQLSIGDTKASETVTSGGYKVQLSFQGSTSRQ